MKNIFPLNSIVHQKYKQTEKVADILSEQLTTFKESTSKDFIARVACGVTENAVLNHAQAWLFKEVLQHVSTEINSNNMSRTEQYHFIINLCNWVNNLQKCTCENYKPYRNS